LNAKTVESGLIVYGLMTASVFPVYKMSKEKLGPCPESFRNHFWLDAAPGPYFVCMKCGAKKLKK